MKRSSPKPQDDGKISLFPFLAVLLCMMGSLLVLLIIVSQRAQATALDEQAAQSTPSPADEKQAAEQAEKLKAHLAVLREAREKLSQRMSSDRQALSHLEDHARRLRDDVERVRAEAKLLAQTQSKQLKAGADAAAEARRVEQLAEEAAKLLKEAGNTGAKAPSYSVVPYDGPNATRRRPIYLECHADSVVIQPEGIVLREDDFDEPLGPDNPLAVAVRAASEYLVRQAPDPAGGVPYPLLIVRPSSIRAYYAARAALESWGEDFGYEMVDEEWKIKYIPPDHQLAGVLENTVAMARRRLEMQRAASGIGRGGNGSGGGSGSDDAEGTGEPGGAGGAMRNQRRGGSAFAPGGNGQQGSSQPGAAPPGQDARGKGVSGQPGGQQGIAGADGISRSGLRPNDGRRAGGSGQRGGSGSGTSSDTPQQGESSQDPNSQTSGSHPPQRLGETSIPASGSSPGSRYSKAGGAASQDGGSGGGEAFGSTMPGAADGAEGLAKSRGKNWALPGASQGSVGVTRPLRIEVAGDRIVIDSGNPGAARKEIALTGTTDAAVEQFVSTVWDQMRGWGIAGRGMYWRPVLNVHVMPGGQQRAAELVRLLDGSGLDVKVQP